METFAPNEIYKLVTVATIVLLAFGLFVAMFIVAFKKKERLLLHINLLQKQELEQELLHSQIEIQEQTLKIISQEIHDNIGQALSLALLNMNQVEPSNDFFETKLNTATTAVGKALQDLRDISKSLNTDSINEIGLITAIENELEIINKSGIKTHFIIEGKMQKLAPKTELILFRMLQESINNIIKHTKAQNLTISAYYGSTHLEILVEDDGIGFNINEIKKGQGLNNLQNRSKFINAQINIESTINKGTTVRIDIPF